MSQPRCSSASGRRLAPLTSNRPSSRRLTAALALTFSMAAVLLLTVASPSMAQARKASCASSSSVHAKRSAHPCGRTATHKKRAHAERGTKRHQARHAVKKHRKRTVGHATAPAAAIQVVATCEDSTVPIQASDGSLSCDDGSEASCPIARTSAAASAPICSIVATTGPASQAACESGSSGQEGEGGPSATEGPLVCAAGSSVSCEEEANLLPVGEEAAASCEAVATE
jgi:hypothetical protein